MRAILPKLTGTDLTERGAEMFSPSQLFAKEIFDMHTAWLDVRKFLDSRVANLRQKASRSVIMTLEHGLHAEAEDREAAVQTAKLIVTNGRRVRQELRTADQPTTGPDDSSQTP